MLAGIMDLMVMLLVCAGGYLIIAPFINYPENFNSGRITVECTPNLSAWKRVGYRELGATVPELLWIPGWCIQRRLDRRNPRAVEIREHLHYLRHLKGKAGDEAEQERMQLEKSLRQLRLEVYRQRVIDDTDYVRQLGPQLEMLRRMRLEMDEALDARTTTYAELP